MAMSLHNNTTAELSPYDHYKAEPPDTIVTTHVFCSVHYREFWTSLHEFLHIYTLLLVICFVGITVNGLSVIVYTRKNMTNSTNRILAVIAFADCICMCSYIPQYFALQESVRKNHPYFTAMAWIIQEYGRTVFHHISVWMTVLLAVWRYLAVIHPFRAKYLCTTRRVTVITVSIVALNLLITLQGYLDARIVEADETKSHLEGGCHAKYCPVWEPVGILRILEYIYQAISRIIPGTVFAASSIRIISKLSEQERERREMLACAQYFQLIKPSRRPTARQTSTDSETSEVDVKEELIAESRGTSVRLIVVVLVFLFTEIPPSILLLWGIFVDPEDMTVYYNECVRHPYYAALLLWYGRACINFFVYFGMSSRYRSTLFHILNHSKMVIWSRRSRRKTKTSESSGPARAAAEPHTDG